MFHFAIPILSLNFRVFVIFSKIPRGIWKISFHMFSYTYILSKKHSRSLLNFFLIGNPTLNCVGWSVQLASQRDHSIAPLPTAKKLKIILKWDFHIYTFRNWNVTNHILILELCGLNHLLVIRHEMDNGRWSVQLTSWQDHSIAPLPAAKKLKIILCKIRMSWFYL